jgi:hypothetical protein
MDRQIFLIDGIAVTEKAFKRRQIFGERKESHFSTWSPKIKPDPRSVPRQIRFADAHEDLPPVPVRPMIARTGV